MKIKIAGKEEEPALTLNIVKSDFNNPENFWFVGRKTGSNTDYIICEVNESGEVAINLGGLRELGLYLVGK